MESPKPAYCQDLILDDGGDGCRYHVCRVKGSSLAVVQRYGRAADRATIGLGMKAPIHGIEIFPAAVPAHRKVFHRGLGTVVGNGFDDGKPWPAVGAVDKGVAEPAIGRVGQFFETILAN